MTATTKAVGTHYDSTHLAVGIDFPESRWRVSFDRPVVGGARAEYFYRGGVPEAPVVAMIVTRGPAEEIGEAARRVLEDLVRNASSMSCEGSTERPGAMVCRGAGTLTLFGRARANVAIDVYAWSLSTGEILMATWLNPDQTLSETQYVLRSITEQ